MFLRLLCLLFAVATCASAQVQVKGYTRKDGTYVQPHTRSGTPASKPASQPATSTGTTSTNTTASYVAGSPSTSDTSNAPAPQPLNGVTVGMSKSQVAAQVGNPNVQSATTWVYTNRGKVRFADDKVAAVEPDGATTTSYVPSGTQYRTPAIANPSIGTSDATATTSATKTTAGKTTNSVATIETEKRNVPTSEKRAIYAEAGISKSEQKNYVIDHKIPLELGGSNDKSNLQPQPKADAKIKDQWENYLTREVKAGKMTQTDAQAEVQRPHSGPPPKK